MRFFKWASERLDGRDGVVCFVTNNSFLDQHAFDGMRKCLGDEFNHIWHLDLHGNVRKNPKLSGTTHNVFGIQVGAGITILARNSASQERFIRYHRVPELWRKTEKLDWLAEAVDLDGVQWQELNPNAKNAWLTEGLEDDFETFVPMGTREAKASFSAENKTLFKMYSLGVATNRDEWCYDWSEKNLREAMVRFIANYNSEVERYTKENSKAAIDSFVNNAPSFLKWTDRLKNALKNKARLSFDESLSRDSMYRPFAKQKLYFDDLLNQRRYQQHRFFPKSETLNRIICVSGIAGTQPFQCLMTDCIPDLHLTGDSQCFPLYTYSLDGSTRFDNITSYALKESRKLYGASVSREDVFYAKYALLHHPQYRAKYAENLKRELPRLPLFLLPDKNPERERRGSAETDADEKARRSRSGFVEYVRIGRALGDLHVGYESVAPHDFVVLDTKPKGQKFSFRVEKMRFDKERSTLRVNDCITLSGFTPQMFEYKLGNRSALDWIVESYRVKEDARSGLISDPNRKDEPRFILDLIGKLATVSLETQRLIAELPPLYEPGA